MVDLEEIFPPILVKQQYTAAEVCLVSELSHGQLKGILDRNQIKLSSNHNPGTGRRRMFTGKDTIALSAVQAVSRVGFPLRWAHILAQQVTAFADRMHIEKVAGTKTPHLALAFYPADQGEDWAFVPIYDGVETAELPTAYQVLDVTREITQTLAKLQAIIDDLPQPSFSPPKPPEKPENVYAPRSNFMKLWEKDVTGAWRYVGLTLEETQILMAHEGVKLDGDDLVYFDGTNNKARELISELIHRREDARLKACFPDLGADM